MKLFIFIGTLLIFALLSNGQDEGVDISDDSAASSDTFDDDISKEKTSLPRKVKYVKPSPRGVHHFLETFDINTIGNKWIKSESKKDVDDESISKYDGEWSIEPSGDSVFDGDKGLVLKSKAKHHAISARLLKPFHFSENKPIVIQYEVKFQNPLDCGGAYVKLLENDAKLNLANFFDKTSFSIMFGPDKCGTDNKYHFIVRFKNPVTGTYEEKHAKRSELLETFFSDGKTHLYTLIIEADNSYKMLIDLNEVNTGSLLKDMTPAINPPKEIVDVNDKKPETWDDREKIEDPEAVKPEDWDETEPRTIADPSAAMPAGWLEDEQENIPDAFAVKPEDWDDATDGEWEAPKVDNPKCKEASGCGKWTPPQVTNPKYKGKWRAPLIDNAHYQGKWEPRKIANPEFFEDLNPFASLTSIAAIGLELWSMTDNIYFDNFIITDDKLVAEQFAKDSWLLKKNLESLSSRSSDSVIDGLVNAANDKPWLWALYIVVVLLPIVIIAVFCCGKSSGAKSSAAAKSKTSASEQDDAKKTDAISKDDETREDDDDADSKREANDQQSAPANLAKSDLEPAANEDEDDNDSNNELLDTDAKVEQEQEEEGSSKKSPIKRRPRKD